MKPTWDDVNARARGLGAHLLGRARLEELADSSDLAELRNGLDRAGYPLSGMGRGPTGTTPPDFEVALRRNYRARTSILVRWCGDRARYLSVVFEDEDRRSLRALLRGAVAGASSERRLSGLVPTPSLPQRALEELARMSTASAIAATLTGWRNPYGPWIRSEAEKPRPDLFRLEILVNRLFAERALRATRRAGRELQRFAEESIDLENALAALALCDDATDVDPEECFLEGGRRLGLENFSEVARAANASEASRALAPAFASTPFARVLEGRAGDAASVELGFFRARVEKLVERARGEPLSPFPLLAFLFRLRAEAIDLRNLVWSLALGAPRSERTASLVSV